MVIAGTNTETGNSLLPWSLPAPTIFSAPGTAGQIAYDSSGFFYICYATNLWTKFTGNLVWTITNLGLGTNTIVAPGWTLPPPLSFSATGTAGQISYDVSGNLYVCYATNSWAQFPTSLFLTSVDFSGTNTVQFLQWTLPPPSGASPTSVQGEISYDSAGAFYLAYLPDEWGILTGNTSFGGGGATPGMLNFSNATSSMFIPLIAGNFP